MKYIKKILRAAGYGLFFSVFALSTSGTALAATKAPAQKQASQSLTASANAKGTTNIQLFFSIAGKAGSVSPIKSKPGTYRLTLRNVNPYVIYFSDVPNRISGLLRINTFVKQWQSGQNSFRKSPPNGNLEAVTSKSVASDQTISLVFALSNPVYNARTKTLIFTAQATHDEFPLNKPIQFKNLALFIDGLNLQGVCFSCV